MLPYRLYTKQLHDLIPDYVFGESLLDIGADLGANQLGSRHRKKFITLSNNGAYLGIDIKQRELPLLKIIEQDIFTWKTDRKFDTILMVEVIEHIQFRDWVKLFEKVKSLLNPNGYLYLSTPANEKLQNYLKNAEKTILGEDNYSDYYQCHVVFGITKKVIRYFLPNAKIGTYYRKRWKQGHGKIMSFARIVKRIITLDITVIPYKFSYIVVWRKEKE